MTTSDNTESDRYKNKEWLRTEYREKRRSDKDIAAECDVSHATISYWREKFDIEKPPDSAYFGVQSGGYEQWQCNAGPGGKETMLVHRLLATLKVDDPSELAGKEVHHKNGHKRDNRLENIVVLSPAEHRKRHTA